MALRQLAFEFALQQEILVVDAFARTDLE